MALKLKELTSNKKFFLGILFLLVILVAYIILQLKSSSIPTTPPVSISPPSPPTPNPQLVISQQKLNFTWETSLPTNTPTHLPFYTITQPLLDTTTIPNISNYFNFFPQHQLTLKPQTLFGSTTTFPFLSPPPNNSSPTTTPIQSLTFLLQTNKHSSLNPTKLSLKYFPIPTSKSIL